MSIFVAVNGWSYIGPLANDAVFSFYFTPRAKSRSSNGAKRAEEILDLMQRMVAAGDNSVRPDVHSFSTVINGE